MTSPGYLFSAGVNVRLDIAVATDGTIPGRGTVATRGTWRPGHVGKTAGYVKIGAATPASPRQRWSVVITGGVHARELAPPDALVSFVEKLLAAYAAGTGVSYPAITADGVAYPAFDISDDAVRSVVERLHLVVAPLVNADGRDFVLAPQPAGTAADVQKLHKEWRKNRRPRPAGVTDPKAAGVDINRNFDILFDFQVHYDVAHAGVATSKDPPADTFCGDDAGSEPETQNLVDLFKSEGVTHFLDVHSTGRTVMYSWGIESNQSNDPFESFMNPFFNGKRDGVTLDRYREFIPADHAKAAEKLATQMCDDIKAQAGGTDATALRRSTYRPIPSAQLYVTTGACDDFCFSRWFTAAAAGRPIRPVTALTMEVGGDVRKGVDHQEGHFWPDYATQFPKIEREVHVAVWSFLAQIAATPVTGADSPSLPFPGSVPVPIPPPPPPPPQTKKACLVATTLYGDPGHPSVVFLRDVRDRQLPATPTGRRFAAWLDTGYDRAAPPIATWLDRRPIAARLARRGVLAPLVLVLRLVSAATTRCPRARAVTQSAVLGAVAGPVVAASRTARRRPGRRDVSPRCPGSRARTGWR